MDNCAKVPHRQLLSEPCTDALGVDCDVGSDPCRFTSSMVSLFGIKLWFQITADSYHFSSIMVRDELAEVLGTFREIQMS